LEIIAQNNLKVDILLTVNTAFMFKSKEITLQLAVYKSLENCVQTWHLCYQMDQGKVQRRATRMIRSFARLAYYRPLRGSDTWPIE